MPNISSIELNLSPNDNIVNASWRVNDRPAGKTLINAADLTQCGDQIRRTLGDLNEYVRDNPPLSSEFDKDFDRYNRILKALRTHGADLHRLLLDMPCPLEQFICVMERRLPLTVFVEDQNVTIPIGFAFDGREREPTTKPSISDFDGFWLSKFMITIWVTSLTSSLDPIVVPVSNFRALFAVDPSEYQDAVEALGERSSELPSVFGIDVGIRETWEDASDAWREMMKFDSVLFFLAHSDGNNIRLAGEEKASFSIKNTFSKNNTQTTTLVVVNACMSLAGNRKGGSSILSIAAREGFAGLVGTEAEILNTHALLCGSYLMHGLCFENLMLGEVFERMRAHPKLFPLNLFYSCYGDRSFRLDTPLPLPIQDPQKVHA